MENFLNVNCKLMFKFDVYYFKKNIDIINYYRLEKVNKLHYWYCTVQHATVLIKITKEHQLTLQNSTGCCMLPCDVTSNATL